MSEERLIDHDLACFGCRYNLRMQPMDGSCPECGLAVAESVRMQTQKGRAFTMDTLPWWVRTCYVVFGVLLPLMAFGMVHPAGLFVEWQSGAWYDIAAMLMGGLAALPFFPVLVFASVCLMLLVLNPARFGRSWVVAVGLMFGLVLGLQYSCLALPALLAMSGGGYDGADSFAFGGFMLTLGFIVANGLRMLIVRGWPEKDYPRLILTLDIVSATCALIVCLVSTVIFPLGIMFSSVLYGLSFVSALMRFGATWWFDQKDGRQRPAPRGAVWTAIGSVALYLAAWPAAVWLALFSYSKLPTQPPQGCYVCTAAAKGHPRLVRAAPVRLADGSVFWVNGQMRVLKAAEWLLAERLPGLHRAIRRVYDTVGPPLAARVRSRWTADVAWLFFAGPALLAWVVLRLAGQHRRIAQAYREPLQNRR